MGNGKAKPRFGLWRAVLLPAALWASGSGAEAPPLKATLIDRYGHQHQVERFAFQGRQELELYLEGQRRMVSLQRIARLRFEGEKGDEEQAVTLILRTGHRQEGTMLTGGASTPHQDAVGGGSSGRRFTGVTELGPFSILVGDVREIVLRHPAGEEPPPEKRLKATVITLEGKRFEVDDLRFRGKQRLDYYRGQDKRFALLDKVARIDFDDSGAGEELRPVTFTFWTGKAVMGAVEASIVRLSGETDKSYQERVNAAFTGKTSSGAFSIGLQNLKQIRFHEEEEAEAAEEESESSQ